MLFACVDKERCSCIHYSFGIELFPESGKMELTIDQGLIIRTNDPIHSNNSAEKAFSHKPFTPLSWANF